jgi:hypothetical protein
MSTSTKILALGTLTAPLSSPQMAETLPKEVPPTLRLYLDGHMDQFWLREDNTGVVFLLNCSSITDARTLLERLPLVEAGLMTYEYIAIGPLMPLGALIGAR